MHILPSARRLCGRFVKGRVERGAGVVAALGPAAMAPAIRRRKRNKQSIDVKRSDPRFTHGPLSRCRQILTVGRFLRACDLLLALVQDLLGGTLDVGNKTARRVRLLIGIALIALGALVQEDLSVVLDDAVVELDGTGDVLGVGTPFVHASHQLECHSRPD